MLNTPGALSSATWIAARGLDGSREPHWYVEITLRPESHTGRFDLNIYPEEWGYVVQIGSRVSSIRVTDLPFVHGRDDHRLLPHTPDLERIGALLAYVEASSVVGFLRRRATVHTNLPRAATAIRAWLATI